MSTIRIIDHASDGINRLIRKVENPQPGLKIAWGYVRQLLQRWFRDKNKTPNSLGGKRTNFWNDIARSVKPIPLQTGARSVKGIIADPRIAQKIYGGTITAKRVRNLTIPLTPEAYGRRASVLEQALGIKLFVLKSDEGKGGRAFLAAGKGGMLKRHYLLIKSVNQDPTPGALPPNSAIQQEINRGFAAWFKRLSGNAGVTFSGESA